jgi:hypothetical protein
MEVSHREIRNTGPVGKFFRLAFFVFNILMVIWLVSYWIHLSDTSTFSERSAPERRSAQSLGP